MSNTNYTHIVMLVDASGSMATTKDATIEGINNFIESQKKLTQDQDRNLSFDDDLGDSKQHFKCTSTLVLFSSPDAYFGTFTGTNGEPGERYYYNKLYENVDLEAATPLSTTNYNPNGGTPLIDAFCKAIGECSAFVARLPEDERPGRIIFVSITDGEENTSTKFKRADLKQKIEDMQKLNWQFIYLGANQDAIQESSGYGVAAGQALTYSATVDGYNDMFSRLTSNVMSKRCVEADMMFTQCISNATTDKSAFESLYKSAISKPADIKWDSTIKDNDDV